VTVFEDQAHGLLPHLGWIDIRHKDHLPKKEGVHQTRDDSTNRTVPNSVGKTGAKYRWESHRGRRLTAFVQRADTAQISPLGFLTFPLGSGEVAAAARRPVSSNPASRPGLRHHDEPVQTGKVPAAATARTSP
ncbi:hypothetical protein, partial [Rhodococcus opacus]|uniref:hypothetical protein n=1 Tax=Rhodococcus opacus TaxID=37919 RepID=UPI001A7E182F